MKISVSTYSFEQKMRRQELRQIDCIRLAKEMGFDAVEFSGLRPPEGMDDESYAALIRETAKKYNLPLSAYMVHLDFLTNDFDDELCAGKRQIDLAAKMGAPLVRHDVSPGRAKIPFSKSLPVFARACRILAEYAAEKGIRNTVENHGFYLQRAVRLEQLYEMVDHENFGLLIDLGNFLCDDDVPYLAVSRLGPYALHVHAKDFFVKTASSPHPGASYNIISNSGCFLRPTIIGNGDVNVYHCLASLAKCGYSSYVAVEFEGMEDCIEGIRMGRENLIRYAAALGI